MELEHYQCPHIITCQKNNWYIHPQYLPWYILIKLEQTRISKLKGLEDGVIPIEPRNWTKSTNQYSSKKRWNNTLDHQTITISIDAHLCFHWLLSLRPRDIATPPDGTMSLFNVYVTLSWSAGQHAIQLLWDFNPAAITQKHSAEILMEDNRLEHLNHETAKWWHTVKEGKKKSWTCKCNQTSLIHFPYYL